MSKRFLTPLGLLSATSDPVSASIGDVYFNSSSNVTRVYYGSAWVNLSASSTLAIHANTASSIAGSLVSGTVASATVSASAIVSSSTNILVTARNIGDVSFNGSSSIVPQRVFYKDTRSTEYNPFTYPGITLHLKTNTTDGLSNGGIFHGVLDLAHWLDSSGGVNHQLGLTDNGNMFIRNSTGSATWSSWSRFIKSTDSLTSLSVTTSSELASIISDETGTGSVVFNTNPVFEGRVTNSSSTGLVIVGTDSGGSISMGRRDGVASTPYIDFNSATASSDFDVRLIASGGSGSSGNGTMSVFGGMTVSGTLTASNVNISGSITTASLTSTFGTIAGWTLSASALTAGTSASTVGLISTPQKDNIAIYAGSTTASAAPFRVTQTGSAFATTKTSGDSSTSLATTAFVSNMIRYNGAVSPLTASVAGYFVIAVNPGTSLNGCIMIPQGTTGRILNALVDRGINSAASAGYIRGYVENNAGAAVGVGNSVPLYYIAW